MPDPEDFGGPTPEIVNRQEAKMRFLCTAVVSGMAAGLWSIGSAAGAQPLPGEELKGAGPGRGRERMVRALQLSDEQQQQARQLFEARRPQMQAFFEKMREGRQRLQGAAESESPDPAQVGELLLEQYRLRQEGRTHREEMQAAFRALLTPEQQRKLDLLKAARPAGEGRGDPGDVGPPEGLIWLPMSH